MGGVGIRVNCELTDDQCPKCNICDHDNSLIKTGETTYFILNVLLPKREKKEAFDFKSNT